MHFMIQKSEVLEKFKEFEAGVTNEIDKIIGTLPTDNGGGVCYSYNTGPGIYGSKPIRPWA